MILWSRDKDQTVLEKIGQLQAKKKFLIKDKNIEQGVETIQRVVQKTLEDQWYQHISARATMAGILTRQHVYQSNPGR